MSRAFTSEGDGWNYCRSRREMCAYADEFGRCIVLKCVLDAPDTTTPAQPPTAAPPPSRP
ncbi:MAG: hypothetical protein LBR33_01310 [Propionibacteriaceae bacterium]|nr:hypothetical protein [Propionibacteriaceae bacterium]